MIALRIARHLAVEAVLGAALWYALIELVYRKVSKPNPNRPIHTGVASLDARRRGRENAWPAS